MMVVDVPERIKKYMKRYRQFKDTKYRCSTKLTRLHFGLGSESENRHGMDKPDATGRIPLRGSCAPRLAMEIGRCQPTNATGSIAFD